MEPLAALGWNAARAEDLEQLYADPDLRLARVVAVDRGAIVVAHENAMEGIAAIRRDHDGGITSAAVGDWVLCRQVADDALAIEQILPRSSCFVRKAAGRRTDAQIVAANLDHVLIVTTVGNDLRASRIERYLSAVLAGGADPIVVVNKADQSHDADAIRQLVDEAALGIPAVLLSAQTGAGLDELVQQLRPSATIALVGSSGVGKSTLVNRLLGEQRLATAPVREGDQKGRHTTTRRELQITASGLLLVDTPGMRELGLWDAEAGIAATFPDLMQLTDSCRFTDCSHAHEPGCAIVEAVEAGLVPDRRLASFQKLLAETHNLDQRRKESNSKRRHKWISKEIKRMKQGQDPPR